MRETRPVLAAAALAAAFTNAASAQSFTPRIGFRNDHTPNATPTITEITYFPSATPIPIDVLFGAFDAQGFTSRGMFNFIGTVTVTDPLGDAQLQYRTGSPGSGLHAPYSFGASSSSTPPARA